MIHIAEGKLMDGNSPQHFRGLNFGNWLLIEHFKIGLPSTESDMRMRMRQLLGDERSEAFWNSYNRNYCTEADFDLLARMGINLLRLPFHFRILQDPLRPHEFLEDGFELLNRAISLARSRGIRVILDLHAAPGAQASDFNADSRFGESMLWEYSLLQEQTATLWKEIARRYKTEDTVLAYEVLNEPVFQGKKQDFARFNLAMLSAIRSEDREHIIIFNFDKHATDVLSLPEELWDDPQTMPSVHYYHQYQYPLRDIRSFPGRHRGKFYSHDDLHRSLETRFVEDRIHRPSFLGEFGLVYQSKNLPAQIALVESEIACCNRRGVHWALWSYKDQGVMGLISPTPETPWMRFVNSHSIRRAYSIYHRELRSIIRRLGKATPLKEPQDLHFGLLKILHRELLDFVLEKLQACTADDLAEMATSFHANNCRPTSREMMDVFARGME